MFLSAVREIIHYKISYPLLISPASMVPAIHIDKDERQLPISVLHW
jgi:hypothetical protein